MADFQILRYLKKWWFLIMIIVAVGCCCIYFYCSSQQYYTASVIIEYTNSRASDGQNPDGSAIDTSEITSASVVTSVIEELGLNTDVESLRSRFTITSIIPDDEEDKKSTAIKNGDEYTYNPTKYLITFKVNSDYTQDYARDVLDTLLSVYFANYSSKYVADLIFPDNSANITADDYEYLNCVDMLQTNGQNIVSYLTTQHEADGTFYSAITGYSFNDLIQRYQYVTDNTLTKLRAYILDNRLAMDPELLIRTNENQKAQYEIQLSNLDKHLEEAKAIIDQFGTKTLEGQQIYQQADGGSLVVTDVEDDHITTRNTQTTYDTLINEYADLEKERVSTEISLAKTQQVLDTYTSDEPINEDPDSEEAQWAKAQIEDIIAEFNELYAIALTTIEDHNQKAGADNLSMRTNIATAEAINLKLYLVLAAVLFLIVGCGAAVLVGRLGDFVDYYLYGDRKTGLPNRQRCDIAIERQVGKLLDEDYACITFKVTLQYPNNPNFTRDMGDELLQSFGTFARVAFKEADFLGYNGDGMFLAFMAHCTPERAEACLDTFDQMANSAYGRKAGVIEYHAGAASTSANGIYEVRGLLRASIQSWKIRVCGLPLDTTERKTM